MKLIFHDDDGYIQDPQQAEYVNHAVQVLEKALILSLEKSQDYGDAWREQGWRGNLSRILAKTSRLRRLLWVPTERVPNHEVVEDTAQDLINLAVFFLLNRKDGNEWGTP